VLLGAGIGLHRQLSLQIKSGDILLTLEFRRAKSQATTLNRSGYRGRMSHKEVLYSFLSHCNDLSKNSIQVKTQYQSHVSETLLLIRGV
jgi:hypothetical protein